MLISITLSLREEEADIDIRLLEDLGPEQRSALRISGKGNVVPFTNQARVARILKLTFIALPHVVSSEQKNELLSTV